MDSQVIVALITGGGALLLGVINAATRVKNGRVVTLEDKALKLEKDLTAARERAKVSERQCEQLIVRNQSLERERADILAELRDQQRELERARIALEMLKGSAGS